MIPSLLQALIAALLATSLATVMLRRELREPIAATFALHLIIAAAAATVVMIAGGAADAGLYVGSFATLCLAVARIDARIMIIPDALVIGLLVVALSAPFRPAPLDQMFGAVVMGGLFAAVRHWHSAMRGEEGLGLGDVKLAVVIGAALGANTALLAGGAAAAAMALWMVARGMTQTIAPFGVGLAGALGVAVATLAILP